MKLDEEVLFMSKKIAALATDSVEDSELGVPRKQMIEDGHQVDIISLKHGKITGDKGQLFDVNKTIDEVKPEDYDALLLPGGGSPDKLRTDDRFVKFVRHFFFNSKPVFAICHGPQFFIQAGILKGRTLTAVKSIIPDLYFAGGITKDEPLVIDGNLITSRTPADLDQFVPAIKKVLNN